MKQIRINLESSEIVLPNKPKNNISLQISDNCDPEDVKQMANMFLTWYITHSIAPQPDVSAASKN